MSRDLPTASASCFPKQSGRREWPQGGGGGRVGGPIPIKLPNKRGNCIGDVADQYRVELPLCPLQRDNVIGFSRTAPSAGRNPSDIIPSKNHWAVHDRAKQIGFFARSARFGGASSE
jgi:hypothetical protein